ncbi:hypothetical protein K9B33_19570 [Sphingobium sp. 3R8]|uniref:nucleotide kinase domain-containing protein n=1 Tax=Sphingobium sp. 3R8 TaxID=2874921 RepID=UPI001CCED30E|nr:nucleotide kinase domain-containing protein [Sphingobium sp. 3R8]MBZ9649741.1 hypothetical protein [Sphingobium sp. 3R8]
MTLYGPMETTIVYDSYWRFAAERLAIYRRRLVDPDGPWTDDAVLRGFRFTNTYRAADKVSQYLIREVQYRSDRSQAPAELFFRTMLFKLFNRIETWELLEREFGTLSWQSADLDAIARVLDTAMQQGNRIYSAAYIMPAPRLGQVRKHANHLVLLRQMMEEGMPGRIERATSLAAVYDSLKPWPGLGGFLAFQYTIDLNYSSLLPFDEGSFVVAGPGALDGIAKCFVSTGGRNAEAVIHEMVDIQEREFARLAIDFHGLFGRRLQPIDCQNLFCEISKYSRVAHPEVPGLSGRTRIKQGYAGQGVLPRPTFPPRWNLSVPEIIPRASAPRQGMLL